MHFRPITLNYPNSRNILSTAPKKQRVREIWPVFLFIKQKSKSVSPPPYSHHCLVASLFQMPDLLLFLIQQIFLLPLFSILWRPPSIYARLFHRTSLHISCALHALAPRKQFTRIRLSLYAIASDGFWSSFRQGHCACH